MMMKADAIILIDVDSSTFDKGAMYFYVGASRARRKFGKLSPMQRRKTVP